jgi:hypothetical protein
MNYIYITHNLKHQTYEQNVVSGSSIYMKASCNIQGKGGIPEFL